MCAMWVAVVYWITVRLLMYAFRVNIDICCMILRQGLLSNNSLGKLGSKGNYY